MNLKSIELTGFKSFAKKDVLTFSSPISGIVGPNGSGKSNIAEAFRFVLGEQSMKSMRGKRGEDLIFNGSPSVSRSNRANVKVVFDNTTKFLDVDYDEVTIERTVHRDGVNEYKINGSQVRLRDILELLAGAHIGSSGHLIISQGEADMILNTSSRKRREMVEEALGLRMYQYKKREGEKKLLKTEENINQVMALRKEVQPHLKFLERQVKKIEKTLFMKEELVNLYAEYLKREDEYISYNKNNIEKEKKEPMHNLRNLDNDLAKAKKILSESDTHDEKSKEVVALEEALRSVRKEKADTARELGRLEGRIIFEERYLEEEKEKVKKGMNESVPLSQIEELFKRTFIHIDEAEGADDKDKIISALAKVKKLLRDFLFSRTGLTKNVTSQGESHLKVLKVKKKDFDETFAVLESKEKENEENYERLKNSIETEKDESREAEKEVFRIMTAQSEIRTKLTKIEALEDRVNIEDEDFKREIAEAVVLVGSGAQYKDFIVTGDDGESLSQEAIASEPREKQAERRKKIEKIKIRLEEAGGGGSEDIMKEYGDVKGRDDFFENELQDLEKSAGSLKELINDLDLQLTNQFKEGIKEINVEFNKFFSLLFDGGSAELILVKEKVRGRADADESLDPPVGGGEEFLGTESSGRTSEDSEEFEGIEVSVSLPHKRLRGLEMLSGGERALTSIAFLFAMSQINPPPFIVLDETDASLDEANSRKYGDMIENLSKKSQLILITHNRETMSRAGILYGVTMGNDGVSKLLSVKLEEVVQVAK
ncbi:AAA family ATPase [Patescibacteria group bacterium]|nr:AAA family ATPase [Patescibacteria group bacterium]